MHHKNDYWTAIGSIAVNQNTDYIQKRRRQKWYQGKIVPKLVDPYWILNWFVLKAFDLKAWEITATAADDLMVQLEDWWMTYSRPRTRQGPVGWYKTTIYEYKLWRWAAIINNFFLHSAVQNPLLLFVLGLNAIPTFVMHLLSSATDLPPDSSSQCSAEATLSLNEEDSGTELALIQLQHSHIYFICSFRWINFSWQVRFDMKFEEPPTFWYWHTGWMA